MTQRFSKALTGTTKEHFRRNFSAHISHAHFLCPSGVLSHLPPWTYSPSTAGEQNLLPSPSKPTTSRFSNLGSQSVQIQQSELRDREPQNWKWKGNEAFGACELQSSKFMIFLIEPLRKLSFLSLGAPLQWTIFIIESRCRARNL